MQMFLMTAEHYSVPGVHVKIARTRDLAVREALVTANIILKDAGMEPVSDENSMYAAIEALQDEHGAAHCYVDITEHEVVLA